MDTRDRQIANLTETVAQLRDELRRLRATLTEEVSVNPGFGLSNDERNMVALLLKHDVVSREKMTFILYGHVNEADWPNVEQTLSTKMFRLRNKLRKFDVHILLRKRVGWRFSPEDKAKLRGEPVVVERPRVVAAVEPDMIRTHKRVDPSRWRREKSVK